MGAGVPPGAEESTAAVRAVRGPTASGFQTPVRNNTSPPASLQNPIQTICTFSVIKNYFLGDVSPSLPPQNQARGSAPTLAPSSASSHAISAQHSWRNTNYSSTAKNFIYTFTYARLTVCLQKAPQTQTDPAWSGLTCFLLLHSLPPAQLEFNPCVNLVHAITARDRARHGGPVPPTQPKSPPPPSIPRLLGHS